RRVRLRGQELPHKQQQLLYGLSGEPRIPRLPYAHDRLAQLPVGENTPAVGGAVDDIRQSAKLLPLFALVLVRPPVRRYSPSGTLELDVTDPRLPDVDRVVRTGTQLLKANLAIGNRV